MAFDREQARWVRERVWMEGQRIVDLPDGGLILEVKVSGLFSIMRWILGFGRHAVVLEPPELKAAVEAEAEGILARSRGAREEGKNVSAGKRPEETSAAAKRARV